MDTIAAISTPVVQASACNQGGISVIRISGEKALAVAAGVFRPFDGRNIANMQGYTACYGQVFDGGEAIDDAVLLIFRAPKSYTGEDVAELSCHGGAYLATRVLRAVLDTGARPAGPGEFTKRAFLAGKLDLSQAEGIMELIGASGRQLHRSALAMRGGALTEKLDAFAGELISLAGELAAWLDYPDEDVPPVTQDSLQNALGKARTGIAKLLTQYDAGALLRGGIDTAIIGRPNAGKSTLMNLLLGYERSIVTDIAGTTRDIVEEQVSLGGFTLHLADTAGIRETEHEVERIGVQRARARMESAQLVLAVFDGAQELTEEDRQLIAQLGGTPAVAIINKSDLPAALDISYIHNHFIHYVEISAKHGEGMEQLTAAISSALALDRLSEGNELIVSERQRACLTEADARLADCEHAIEDGITLDAVSALLDGAIAVLFELSGRRVTDAVVDEVFSRFCVGK